MDNPETFYKKDFINYRGKTVDTNEYYTEVIAEFLCQNIDSYKNSIPTISRQESYFTAGHDGIHKDSNRKEETIAMDMFKQGSFSFIGSIVDYQTPLKNKQTDKAGKMDLLSFDGQTLRILELKKPDSDETMLRCVLEGFTYLQTVDKRKLIEDFNNGYQKHKRINLNIPSNAKVKACPFVFKSFKNDKGSQVGIQYAEYCENRKWLLELMCQLDSTPYFINGDENNYIVEDK